ncbi:flagella basal body P-ring formation protein FlgA [Nitrosospira sp. Nl5]|uniref:flagellar basal body P-ring formation chaperone FlgA n=1 Tax=Nitrosospira sp. Nl5 TaxID=200120 RepID=UPI0008875A22|nr:flagellar basal body P-ring formation chaperone FlgA [Nitrosospira sp. Nl5]SCY06573.1 flagella basal body P-ring formation protein FlgA [Nitrosospira sp. Nl5]
MSISYLRLLSFGMSLIALFSGPAFASALATANGKQDPRLIQEAVTNFLHTQSAGLPGQAEITLGEIDGRLNLPSCAALEPTLPPGSRAWGNTTVMVRCAVPHPWTVYVRASVKVVADYVVSARPLVQGQVLTAADLAARRGDLTQLPPGIVTDPREAVGRAMAGSIPFGSPLRQDMLRTRAAVIQNQNVKLVSSGRGFSISAEGKALANAAEGQTVQVRSVSGLVVSGTARAGAIVEVSY